MVHADTVRPNNNARHAAGCAECQHRLEVCNRVAGVDFEKFESELQKLQEDAKYMAKLATNTSDSLKARTPAPSQAKTGVSGLFAAFQKRPGAKTNATLPERTALALSKKYQILASKIKLVDLQAASVTRRLHTDLEKERELHQETSDQLQMLLAKQAATERARASLESQLRSKVDEVQLMRAHLENLTRSNSNKNNNRPSIVNSERGSNGTSVKSILSTKNSRGAQQGRVATMRDLIAHRHVQRSQR